MQDEKDPFGCDPFAVLHAPTRDGSMAGRSASPGPALPPKKNKQPPPRPAPPRPAPPGPKSPVQDAFGAARNDPFAAEGAGGGAFANFADFDDKVDNSAMWVFLLVREVLKIKTNRDENSSLVFISYSPTQLCFKTKLKANTLFQFVAA